MLELSLREAGASPPVQTPLHPASVQEHALKTIHENQPWVLWSVTFQGASGLPGAPAVLPLPSCLMGASRVPAVSLDLHLCTAIPAESQKHQSSQGQM